MTRLEERVSDGEAVPTVATLPEPDASPDTFDERWLARQTAGQAQFARTRQRITTFGVLGMLTAVLLIIWMAFAR